MGARTTVTPFPSSKRFDRDIARKGTLCASVLAEGRRLSDQRKFGPPLFELVARACDLLDDIDEILVALDPERNAESFAAAAALHRELEHIQTTVSAPSRVQEPSSRVLLAR